MRNLTKKLGQLKSRIGKRKRLETAPFVKPSVLYDLANPPRRERRRIERYARQTWIERPFRGVCSKPQRHALMKVAAGANARRIAEEDVLYGIG